jgi:hypothetical protein
MEDWKELGAEFLKVAEAEGWVLVEDMKMFELLGGNG